MRLLIADTLPAEDIERLREIVGEVDYDPSLTHETLADHIVGVNALVVRGTKVTREVIERTETLELIVRSGVGTENIDLEAASARGIYVTNCPDKNAAAVAELTMALLLAVDRRIPEQALILREGGWDKESYSKADGLKGKLFGVIGTGSVGKEVIKRAKAFDMCVLAWSPSFTPEKAMELGVACADSMDEVITKSDVVSLHVAYNPDTHHLLDAERISRMKPGTIVLNTSRGPVVDNRALAEALRAGRIRAGLDVYENEPEEKKAEFHNALVGVPNWVGTCHIGASTQQAQKATADETVRIIQTYLETGNVENCVNFARRTPAAYELIARHYDRIGVLTGILNDLRTYRINVHEVHNIIFEGAKAAVARIQLEKKPPKELLDKMAKRKDEIIHLNLVELKREAGQAGPTEPHVSIER